MAYTKNYYHILGLGAPGPGSPSSLSPQPKSADLRRAYRVALLAAHPDKNKVPAEKKGKTVYSVDDVKEAYTVLDNGATRREYDNWAMRNPHILSTDTRATVGSNLSADNDFLLGLELLDLSDFKESSVAGEEQMSWTRKCRCGDDEGFRIREDDLEDAEGRGEKEVLVGCGGCSLWVRVGFEVEEG